jgi:hypothetical protein
MKKFGGAGRPGAWLGALSLGLWLAAGPAQAQPAQKPGEQWAVLIAVQEHRYHPQANLKFTTQDADQLGKILTERAGVPADHILEMNDRSPPNRQPTRDNLLRELPAFLAKAKADDRVVVFFSGHGELHDGQTYLVPADFRNEQKPQTLVPISKVREALTQCQAATKFLILDCCHAGGERAVGQASLPAETVAKALEPRNVPGLVVLASCQAEEKSYEWRERRHGYFTYWLCRALEGGADANGDGILTADEVYDYTHERVRKTVSDLVGESQTPVRIISARVVGVPRVLALRPEPPETLCRRLAEHLDLEVRREKMKKVGVLEFLQPLGRTEGLARANLPAYCAERVRAALLQLAGSSYQVIRGEDMPQLTRGVRVEDIEDPDKVRRMAQQGGGLDAVVTGYLRRRGRTLNVQCDLIATATSNSLVKPSGVLPLTEELLADNGASFDNRQRPNGDPHEPAVVNHVQQAQQVHPLLKPDFPFQVEVWSSLPGQKPKKKEFLKVAAVEGQEKLEAGQKELLMGARSGEEFEIRVTNNWKAGPVAMTLLVDGINSLGQRRERLGQAWSWVLQPSMSYPFEGWYLPNKQGAQAGRKGDFTLKRFQFTDIAHSVAGRQQFGESIGLITLAFYREYGRALAVGEGREEQRQLRTVDFKPGRLLAVVQIRYVDERDLLKLLDGQ